MKKLLLFLILIIYIGCFNQKIINSSNIKQPIEIQLSKFRTQCMQDSCYQEQDSQKRKLIFSCIDSVLQDFSADSIVRTNGSFFEVRLYKKGYSSKICDSLISDCEMKLPEIYRNAYVQTENPPCAIEGCFGRAIFDSAFNLIYLK